jgi:hypothetical protein
MDIEKLFARSSGESSKTIRGTTVTFRRGHVMFMGEHSYPWNAYISENHHEINIAYNCNTKAECEKEAREYLRLQS